MTIFESVPIAAFCLAMVFVLLASLYAIVLISSSAIAFFAKGKTAAQAIPAAAPEVRSEPAPGGLTLTNVDEPTAAMIMAIVSHESGIPVAELNFKSIKAL